MEMLQQMSRILMEFSLTESAKPIDQLPLLQKIQEKIEKNQELIFVLPAFPAKSPSQHKTRGKLPDYGEVLALKNLQGLCDQLSALYPPGAKVAICSDGRVFSDVVNVSDQSIDLYGEGIKTIIAEYDLRSLTVLSMDDLYPDRNPEELRKILNDFYAASPAEVKTQVLVDDNARQLFNGIHRFLLEDALEMNPHRSKNSLSQETKKNAYELLRRSNAWSELLREHFREALRLSIHPHPLHHEKFGIKLVPSSSKWATPWHNVVVKIKDRYELMHHREALKNKGVLKWEREKYAYFEITDSE